MGHPGPTGSSPSGIGGRPEGGTRTGALRTVSAGCSGLAGGAGERFGSLFASACDAPFAVTMGRAGLAGAAGAGRVLAGRRGAVAAFPRPASTRGVAAGRAGVPVSRLASGAAARSALAAAPAGTPGDRRPGARRGSLVADGVAAEPGAGDVAACAAGAASAPGAGTADPLAPDSEMPRSAHATSGSALGTPESEVATQTRSIATAI